MTVDSRESSAREVAEVEPPGTNQRKWNRPSWNSLSASLGYPVRDQRPSGHEGGVSDPIGVPGRTAQPQGTSEVARRVHTRVVTGPTRCGVWFGQRGGQLCRDRLRRGYLPPPRVRASRPVARPHSGGSEISTVIRSQGGAVKNGGWPTIETKRDEKDQETSVHAVQGWWPGAWSNRRPSDFQFQVHPGGVGLPGILLAVVTSWKNQKHPEHWSYWTVRWTPRRCIGAAPAHAACT
jgi:hypothetical protein